MDGKSDNFAEFAENAEAGEGTTAWVGEGAGGDETDIVESVTVQAETLTAWSEADDEEPDSPRKPWRFVWGIVASVLVVCALVVTVVLNVLQKGNPAPNAGPAPSTHAPPQPVLDGTYRVDYNFAKQTENGAPYGQPNIGNIAWYAFRSSCRHTGCFATGTKLDANNHGVVSNPSRTVELHFADGHWQLKPLQIQRQLPQCLGADGKSVVAGAATAIVTWSLEPQPDGTLRGVDTNTTLTNECGTQGEVQQAPMAATRTGDVTASVTLADPATVAASLTNDTAVPPTPGPALDGTYRLDQDLAKQTANGAPTRTVGTPSELDWWALRSLCTSKCVATGVEVDARNHQEATNNTRVVLHFVDGQWRNTPTLGTNGCGGNWTKQRQQETESWSLTPQPDRTIRGTHTTSVLTNECGAQGIVYRTPISLTWVGDVAPSVVLADPALFATVE